MAPSFETCGFDDGSNWQGEDLDYDGCMTNSFTENVSFDRSSSNSWQDPSEVDGYSGYSKMKDVGNNSRHNFDFCLQGEQSGSGDAHQRVSLDGFEDIYDENYVPPLPPPIVIPGLSRSAFGQSSSCNSQNDSKMNNAKSPGLSHTFGHSSACSNRSNNENFPRQHIKAKKRSRDAEQLYPITEVFNPVFLQNRRQESSSRPNFAAILIKCFISKAARMTSNVSGSRGKNKLDKDISAAHRCQLTG